MKTIESAVRILKDMDTDVILVQRPRGIVFPDLGNRVFQATEDELIPTLKDIKNRYNPRSLALISVEGIIDVSEVIRKSGLRCKCFSVDCHGRPEEDVVKNILDEGCRAGLIVADSHERQLAVMERISEAERRWIDSEKTYISPSVSPTKMNVGRKIADVLRSGGRVAVVMLADRENAYRFADMFVAVDEARRLLGGKTYFAANLDPSEGLSRVRRDCSNVNAELDADGVSVDFVAGGLDDYAYSAESIAPKIDAFEPDLKVILGMCSAYPDLGRNDVLITDDPDAYSEYLKRNYLSVVGEIPSKRMVSCTTGLVHLELADTIREIIRG